MSFRWACVEDGGLFLALIRRFDSDEQLVPFLVLARFWWDPQGRVRSSS